MQQAADLHFEIKIAASPITFKLPSVTNASDKSQYKNLNIRCWQNLK